MYVICLSNTLYRSRATINFTTIQLTLLKIIRGCFWKKALIIALSLLSAYCAVSKILACYYPPNTSFGSFPIIILSKINFVGDAETMLLNK